MALFVVLDDFASGAARLQAGTVIDDGLHDVPALRASGLVAAPVTDATVSAAIQAYLSQRGVGPRELDPYGSMLGGLLGSNGGASFVGTLSGLSVQAALANAGSVRELIYTNGPISGPDMFDDWDNLMAKFVTIDGPRKIRGYQTGAAPLTIPPGVYPFRFGDILAGNTTFPTAFVCDDGVTLEELAQLEDNCNLYFNNTSAPGIVLNDMAMNAGFTVFSAFGGSGIQNDGNVPVLTWDKNVGAFPGGPLLINLPLFSQFTGLGTFPVIHVEPAGAYTSLLILQTFLGAIVNDGVLSGAMGAGAAVLQAWVSDGSSYISTNQPAWAGVPFNTPGFYQSRVNSVRRFSNTNTVVAAGAYNAGVYPGATPGDEFVRCAPDGSLTPIVVQLPPARRNPGSVITLKRANADVATAISAVPDSTDTIDGVNAPDAVPLTLNAWRRYTSDGTAWYREGSGL